MDKCSYCGAEIKAGQTQCPDCGASLAGAPQKTLNVENQLLLEMRAVFGIWITIRQHLLLFVFGPWFLGPLVLMFPVMLIYMIISHGNPSITTDAFLLTLDWLSIPAAYVFLFWLYAWRAKRTSCRVYNTYIECSHYKFKTGHRTIDMRNIAYINSRQSGFQNKYDLGTIVIGVRPAQVNNVIILKNISNFTASFSKLQELTHAGNK